jgi:hypothetical protein
LESDEDVAETVDDEEVDENSKLLLAKCGDEEDAGASGSDLYSTPDLLGDCTAPMLDVIDDDDATDDSSREEDNDGMPSNPKCNTRAIL